MGHLPRTLRPSRAIAAVIVAATALGGSVSACGASTPTPTSQSRQAVFPVTITRTGGIAGLHDVLTVAGDGKVTLERGGQRPRRCQLTPVAVQAATKAAAQVPWSRVTPGRTQPSFPDDMVTTLQSPAGGPVRVEDPQVGTQAQVFLDLLNDLGGDPAASRTCRPR